MSRYKAVVAYEGSLFKGWQVQPQSISVQGCIEKTLSRMEKSEVSITGAGRTDRGVNALGQVFHFDSELQIPIERFALAINNQLTDGIHIRSIEEVSDSFHARKDALWKRYRYKIELGEYQLFERYHVLQLNRDLDIEAMKQVSTLFVGTHDFTSFNTTPLSIRPIQVKTIYEISFTQVGTQLWIDYVGNSFLRYMVRMLTQTMINVGLHKLEYQEVERLLLTKEKGLVFYNARPEGLTLMEVHY